MKVWMQYAAAGAVLTLVVCGVLTAVSSPATRPAIWFGAALGYVLQLAAFGALQAVRDNAQLFLLGWAAGIGLRFVAVGVVAFWVMRTNVLPPEAALLSLVGFVVLLLFLEPVFLREGRAKQ